MTKQIHCCQCQKEVEARLTYGKEIYSHRDDLHALPFWICDICKNYVGTHHKTKDKTKPLGNIPTKELREARKHIHALLDPIWQNKEGDEKWKERARIYRFLTEELGYKYHTAEIKTIEESRVVYRLVQFYIKKGYLILTQPKSK